MNNYKNLHDQQLKSPKWQKRRLQILEKDNWTCQACGTQEKTLHVHHLYYVDGKNLWDYNDHELITLCEDCHKIEHNTIINELIESLHTLGVSNLELEMLLADIKLQIESKHDDIFSKNCKVKNVNIFGNLDTLENLSNRRKKFFIVERHH